MKHEKDQGIITIIIFLMLLFFGTARLLLALPMEMEKSGDLSASARTGADARARARESDEVASGDGAVQTSQETTLAVSENDVDHHGITLEHFQNALASNSDARRFVIAEDGSIQPREGISGAAEKNRSENLTITKALRMALAREHPTELVEELLPRPNMLINPGAPLSAAKLKETFEILEELNSFDRLEAIERTERWSEASSRESFSTKKPLSLDFSNHFPIFADSAYLQEKETVGKALQQMIEASQHENNRGRYYVEADQIWAQAQATWESRTAAQWEAEAKTKALTHANERLERAKEIFDNTKLDETALGRIASLAGRGAQVSAAIPVPHAQGVSAILGTVSTITENVNYFWTHADVDASELLQRLAARAVDSAQEALRKANEAAPGIDQLAQHAEEEARLREVSARKADLELLQPPVTSFHEADWNDWATRVIQAGRGDPSTIPFLADHGMTDPVWAAEIVKTVGQTKALSEAQAHKAEKQNRLEPFEKAFQETSAIFEKAREATIQAEKEVTTAQGRLVAATQFHAHWKSELEESNAALNELEKPANARKPGNDQAIKIQKAKFSLAWKNFQQASSDLKICEEFLSSAQVTLATEEAKMLPLRNAATTAEEILLRNCERASLSNLDSKSLERAEIVLRLPQLHEKSALTAQELESRNAAAATQLTAIQAPEILDKAYATIGRASLKVQRGEPIFENKLSSKSATITTEPLLPEIKEPNAEDIARWQAAEHAEDFLDERDEVIATIKSRCAATASAASSSNAAPAQEASPIKKAAGSSGLAAISEEGEETSRDSEETPNCDLENRNLARERGTNHSREHCQHSE